MTEIFETHNNFIPTFMKDIYCLKSQIQSKKRMPNVAPKIQSYDFRIERILYLAGKLWHNVQRKLKNH